MDLYISVCIVILIIIIAAVLNIKCAEPKSISSDKLTYRLFDYKTPTGVRVIADITGIGANRAQSLKALQNHLATGYENIRMRSKPLKVDFIIDLRVPDEYLSFVPKLPFDVNERVKYLNSRGWIYVNKTVTPGKASTVAEIERLLAGAESPNVQYQLKPNVQSPEKCTDEISNCGDLIAENNCFSNPVEMSQKCPKSCGLCGMSAEDLQKAKESVKDITSIICEEDRAQVEADKLRDFRFAL